MIKIISNTADFETLKDDWNTLFSNSRDVTFFQTYDYNKIAWETFHTDKDRLYILVSKDGKKNTEALFPFYIDAKGRLRFINDRHTDFCNILISKNLCGIHNLMYEVYQQIAAEKMIKAVFLDNLLSQSPVLCYWKVFFGNAFAFSQTEHSWLNCPHSDTIIGEFKHLTAKERNRMNNNNKKSAHCTMEIFKTPGRPYPAEAIDTLIQTMEEAGIRNSGYFNAQMLSFMRRLYDSGLIEIPVLYEDNLPVSLGFIFVTPANDRCMRWVILYKDKKYNLWNNLRYIIEKSQQNDIIIDFGRGGYDYKMTNFRPEVENLYRLMASKTLWGNWYILFKTGASHLRKTFKKIRTK